jgi:hypothetical protein
MCDSLLGNRLVGSAGAVLARMGPDEDEPKTKQMG